MPLWVIIVMVLMGALFAVKLFYVLGTGGLLPLTQGAIFVSTSTLMRFRSPFWTGSVWNRPSTRALPKHRALQGNLLPTRNFNKGWSTSHEDRCNCRHPSKIPQYPFTGGGRTLFRPCGFYTARGRPVCSGGALRFFQQDRVRGLGQSG